MFTVIAFMLGGMVTGFLFRRRKILFIHRIILILIWLLLFLLGLEVGQNEQVVQKFASLGLEASVIALLTTLGSVTGAWLLWLGIKKKDTN